MQGYINNAGAEQVFTSRHSQSRLGGIFRVSRVGPDFLHGPAAENINHRRGALEVRDTVIGKLYCVWDQYIAEDSANNRSFQGRERQEMPLVHKGLWVP